MLFTPTQPFTPRDDDYHVVTHTDTFWTPLDTLRKVWQCVRDPMRTLWTLLSNVPPPPLQLTKVPY